MGSTVLTGKRAGAFQRANGEWVFVMFERTYEKNCYPHHDHWSACTIGNYAAVMHRVFRHATSCEGGMLQARSGYIRPENYIESWRQELAKPMLLCDRTIKLQVSKSFNGSVPESSLDEVRSALIKAELEDKFDALVADGLTVSLIGDVDLLIALYGESGPFSAWRILSIDDCGSVPQVASVPSLLSANKVMEHMPDLRCFSIDDENRLVSYDRKPWTHAGWNYNAVGSFITEVAYGLDMLSPGFAKRAIPEVREKLRKASPLPPDTKLIVTRAPAGVDKWRIGTADEIARGLGLVGQTEPAPSRYSFHFREVLGELNSLLLYKLNGFDQSQVVWNISDAQASPITAAPNAEREPQLSFALF
jgi:hypothetical protein